MSDCVILGIVAAVASTVCACVGSLTTAYVAVITIKSAHKLPEKDPMFEVRPADDLEREK